MSDRRAQQILKDLFIRCRKFIKNFNNYKLKYDCQRSFKNS